MTTNENPWDEAKRAKNREKHTVDFADAEKLDWTGALTVEDHRHSDREARYVTLGMIGNRLHVLVWTPRDGGRRIISLRKANKREVRIYNDFV